MYLSDEAFRKVASLICRRTGITYETGKKEYVQKRIEKRLERLGMDDFGDYYRMLESPENAEFDRLVNELTVNETYFFRDFPQLRNFAEDVLPQVAEEKADRNDHRIKIWSAACSTGEEPYTLAIILREMLDEPEKWDLSILASDINSKVLQSARIGMYDHRSVRDVPPEYLEKYFIRANGMYMIDDSLRKYVHFRKINLVDSEAIRSVTGCDFIFCRNVLIYFDDRSREKVLEDFCDCLNPGGFLFLGLSESLRRIPTVYEMRRIGGMIVYSKQKWGTMRQAWVESAYDEICVGCRTYRFAGGAVAGLDERPGRPGTATSAPGSARR